MKSELIAQIEPLRVQVEATAKKNAFHAKEETQTVNGRLVKIENEAKQKTARGEALFAEMKREFVQISIGESAGRTDQRAGWRHCALCIQRLRAICSTPSGSKEY